MFGDEIEIGSLTLNPVNSYDNFIAKLQWAGTTGGNEFLSHEQNIMVYPNPASGQITVSVKNENILYFEMIDKTGQLMFKSNNVTSVHTNDVTSVHACHTYSFNLSGLTPGLYIVNFYTKNNRVLSKKVIVNP